MAVVWVKAEAAGRERGMGKQCLRKKTLVLVIDKGEGRVKEAHFWNKLSGW